MSFFKTLAAAIASDVAKSKPSELPIPEGDDGKRLYNGKADGGRGKMTVNAEIKYLNLKANRGV